MALPGNFAAETSAPAIDSAVSFIIAVDLLAIFAALAVVAGLLAAIPAQL